jgi:hypothetical protein
MSVRCGRGVRPVRDESLPVPRATHVRLLAATRSSSENSRLSGALQLTAEHRGEPQQAVHDRGDTRVRRRGILLCHGRSSQAGLMLAGVWLTSTAPLDDEHERLAVRLLLCPVTHESAQA